MGREVPQLLHCRIAGNAAIYLFAEGEVGEGTQYSMSGGRV